LIGQWGGGGFQLKGGKQVFAQQGLLSNKFLDFFEKLINIDDIIEIIITLLFKWAPSLISAVEKLVFIYPQYRLSNGSKIKCQ